MADILRLELAAALFRTIRSGFARAGAAQRPVDEIWAVRVDCRCRGEKVIVEVVFVGGFHRIFPGRTAVEVLLGEGLVGLGFANVVTDVIVNLAK